MSKRYEDININDPRLFIDPRTQRPFEATKAEQIANDWDEDALATIVLSEREDGQLAIIDGQTRWGAGKIRNWKGNFHAEIRTGLSIPQEADAFLQLNNGKSVPTIAKFSVRITRGDHAPNEILRILAGYGWKIAMGKANGNFRAVSSAEDAFKAGGTDGQFHVDRIIKAITKAWGLESDGMHQNIFSGLSKLFLRYGNDVDQHRLNLVMQKFTPRQLEAKASLRQSMVGGTQAMSMAELIRENYNNGMRKNTLPEWK